MELILTRLAYADIADIFNYTLDTWGERQAFKYQAYLDEALEKITKNPLRIESKNANEYFANARSIKVEKHYIFYVAENKQVVIFKSITSINGYE